VKGKFGEIRAKFYFLILFHKKEDKKRDFWVLFGLIGRLPNYQSLFENY